MPPENKDCIFDYCTYVDCSFYREKVHFVDPIIAWVDPDSEINLIEAASNQQISPFYPLKECEKRKGYLCFFKERART